MKKLLIWGAGDQGHVTLECALAMNAYEQIDFLEIKEKGSRKIINHTVFKESEFDKVVKLYDEVIVATGSNDLREEKIKMLLAFGIPLATIVHPTALISSSAKIGSGTTILANVIININTKVGIGCIVNNGAIIEHDCMVGNYVNICPKFAMAGHSSIGYKSYLGIGSTVIDDIRIGNRVTVGAGAVVVSNISDNIVAIGVPAKKMLVDK